MHGFGPMFPFYAVLVGPAGAAIGDPDLWDHLSAETCLDLCPPALQPEGPAPWPHARPSRPSPGAPGPVPPPCARPRMDVPQVAVPRGTDQPDNAALPARSGGAGVVVAPEDFGVESIRAAVATVTGDPSYGDAARRLQREIAAMPDADEVLARLLDETDVCA